jgi:hypothetical protein
METNIRELILRELPGLITQDAQIRDWVLQLVKDYAPSRSETEGRFEQMLAEFRQMRQEDQQRWEATREEYERRWQEFMKQQREESDRRWREQKEEFEQRWREQKEEFEQRWREQKEEFEQRWREQKEEFEQRWREQKEEFEQRWREQKEESEQRWQEYMKQQKEESEQRWEKYKTESDRRWQEYLQQQKAEREEAERRWQEYMAELRREWEEYKQEQRQLMERLDRKIDALGARWGLRSENTFRNALRGILEKTFNVKVERVVYQDESGEVFGRPATIELDILIHNGEVLACELKSSATFSDAWIFERKVRFYEKRTGRKVHRALLISPFIPPKERKPIRELGLEIYSDAEDVKP